MPHFTDTQLAMRESIRRMVDKEIRPIAAEIDATDRIPERIFHLFGDMGLMQLWVPEEYGGPGGDLTSVCMAREEISRVSEACALIAGMNSIGVILPLLHFGTEEQKRRWLPEVAKGRTWTAVAMTEPESGSDVASMKTNAKRDGDSWVLNGQKCYITWGNMAHWILVFARTSGEKGFQGISCFLMDTKSPGFRVGKNEKKMGLNGVPNVQIFFDNVRIPAENMVCEEGRGFITCMRILDMNRPTIGAASVGVAQGALDLALNHARERKQFGRAIGQFQGLQWMLADIGMQIEAARALVYRAAWLVSVNKPDVKLSAMAKYFATETANQCADQATRIFGSYGFAMEYDAQRYFRDARFLLYGAGTSEILLSLIAKEMGAI